MMTISIRIKLMVAVEDRDTTRLRGKEAHWPLEAPNNDHILEEPPQVGDLPP